MKDIEIKCPHCNFELSKEDDVTLIERTSATHGYIFKDGIFSLRTTDEYAGNGLECANCKKDVTSFIKELGVEIDF